MTTITLNIKNNNVTADKLAIGDIGQFVSGSSGGSGFFVGAMVLRTSGGFANIGTGEEVGVANGPNFLVIKMMSGDSFTATVQ